MIRQAKRPTPTSHLVLGAVGLFTIASITLGLGTIRIFKIPAGSMIPTLFDGDRVVASGLTFAFRQPRLGEMAIFESPETPGQDFVKRVLALPGDTLRFEHEQPFINEWPIPRCLVGVGSTDRGPGGRAQKGTFYVEYLSGTSYLAFFDDDVVEEDKSGPVTAKAGEFLAIGDNRRNSYDSRVWFKGDGGGASLSSLRGRPLFVWMSFFPAGGADASRSGIGFSKPLLPTAAASLEPALAKCLTDAPPYEKTVPPAPH